MRILSVVSIVSLVVLAAGCGEAVKPPVDTPIIRKSTQTLVSSNKCSVAAPNCTGQAYEVVLTLDKARILGREFMYNLDLQYSAQYDKSMDLYTQSEVVGNTPVVFRIMGNTLELVTDNKLKFPSDNNHPEDVIGRFRILDQTDSTITVSGLNSAPYLATQMGPADLSNPPAPGTPVTYLDHWIRSFEFDASSNILLQETSLKMSDGKTIVEFMESIYPRETLKPGKLFTKFEMNPEEARGVGATTGPVDRYRFLPSDPIVLHDQNSEKKIAYGEHFDISPASDGTFKTIDWYVTPNIPDEDIEPVKEAVEGWNRYFTKMKGINSPVMRFMGKLPANVKIGDPRYNVINWDSRLIAGAAYESQAADPETGLQSHSLIYMPAAWLKIGSDYWAKGIGSDPIPASSSGSALGKFALVSQKLKCERDMTETTALLSSGRLMEEDMKKFGVQLLKQTLFHEVGHALGFAHNFAGSLSYDPADPKSMFSTSIMDYNDYEIERGAFFDVNSADGPLLEYDRQMMSTLYNFDSATGRGKDVAATDPVVPACNDDEADKEEGGVNAICIRYDIQKDPTASIVTAAHRIEEAQLAGELTLSQALARISDITLTSSRLNEAKTKEDLEALTKRFSLALIGSMDFYIVSDVASLDRTARTNVKSLLELSQKKNEKLPADYDAALMRERVFAGVQKALAMKDLPAAPKKALQDAIQDGASRLAGTPYAQLMKAEDRTTLVAQLVKSITAETLDKFTQDEELGKPVRGKSYSGPVGMVQGRAKLLTALARHTAADFFLGKEADAQVDYEKNVASLLADIVVDPSRPAPERIAAAGAVGTYFVTGRPGAALQDNVTKKLSAEADAAITQKARHTVSAILKALSSASSGS